MPVPHVAKEDGGSNGAAYFRCGDIRLTSRRKPDHFRKEFSVASSISNAPSDLLEQTTTVYPSSG